MPYFPYHLRMNKFLLILSCLFFSTYTHAEYHFSYYPQKQITEFLLQSPAEKLDTIKKADIEIFKYFTKGEPTKDVEASQLLELISVVPDDQFRQFRSSMKTDVLGMFLSHKIPEYEVIKDTLLLSHEADTWTLAHELSHALIDQQRPNTLNFSRLADAKEDYEESMRSFRMNGKFISDTQVRSTFEAIKTWTRMQIDILYIFELEEVKIERALGELYLHNPLMRLNKETYDRSGWYIKRNCDLAVNKAKMTKDVMEYFETLVPDHLVSEMKPQLDTLSDYLKSNYDQISSYCLN